MKIVHIALDYNDPQASYAKDLSGDFPYCLCLSDASKLGAIPTDQIIKALQALPPTVTELNLSDNDLFKKTDEELAAILAAIPATVRKVNLSDNQLETLSGGGFDLVFKRLKAFTLDLSGNKLGQLPNKTLAAAFGALGRVGELILHHTNLFEKSGEELAFIFKSLASKVSSVNLGGNSLGDKTASVLKTIHHAITELKLGSNKLGDNPISALNDAFKELAQAKKLSSLSLTYNLLQQKSCDDLCALFKLIPPTVTHLDLGNNDLAAFEAEELKKILLAIPDTVTELSLQDCFKKIRNDDYFVTAFEGIKTTLTSLDYSASQLGFNNGSKLKKLLAATPGTISKLNLGHNWLSRLNDLTLVFKDIPSAVTNVNFIDNHFTINSDFVSALHHLPTKLSTLNLSYNKISNEDLPDFKTLPANITELDLSNCDLDLLPLDSLLLVLNSLPDTVRKIILGPNKRPSQRSAEDCQALRLAMADKPFFVEGIGEDPQAPLLETLAEELPAPVLQDLILSYLLQEGDSLPQRESPDSNEDLTPMPPIEASLLLRFICHPATKVVSALFLIAGLSGLIALAIGVASLGLAVASVASVVIGGGLLAASFFASRPLVEDSAPGLTVPPP